MSDKRLLIGLVFVSVTALMVTGSVWLMQATPGEAPVLQPGPAATHRSGTVEANPFAKGEYMPPSASKAPSGAEGTGVFRIDENGNLVLDGDTRIRLDILVSALPKNATSHELQAIEASAVAGLPKQAAQQALRVLNTYIRYLSAETELNAGLANGNASSPEEMFNKVIALRRQHLGAQVADALFAAQETHDRYGIQIAMMEMDQKLTAQDKLARIEALQRALPASAVALNSDLDASRSALAMEQGVATLRQQGASEVQVLQLRERHVGAEAAKNIGEMEAQKMDWERKQQAFLREKNAIAQMSLTEQQKRERMEMVLSQLYSDEELPAARASNQVRAGSQTLQN